MQLDESRLKNLIRDCKAPELEEKSWAAVAKVLTRLKVASEIHEEGFVLYLYQLEAEDTIWRSHSDKLKWSFSTFIRKNNICDPVRYADCKVALARTPLDVLKKIGLNAAVLVTKKLHPSLHKFGFDEIVGYMSSNRKRDPLLKLEVLRLIRVVEEANPGLIEKKVRVDSRTATKNELAQARETIKQLERKVELLEGRNKKLKSQVDDLKAALSRRRGSRGLKVAA